jgi:type II secretory pathway pseudopilin PulG
MIRPNKNSGFTLLELLIAAGITVVIVVLLGTMAGALMSTAARANQRIDAFRDARAALQMIQRDLSNLVPSQWNPDPSVAPTPLPCQASTTPSTVVTRPAAYFALQNIYVDPGASNQQIYALISAKASGSGTPNQGDVCAVGYYCRWDDQLHAYTLRRFYRPAGSPVTCPPDSLSTFDVIKNPTGVNYASASELYVPSSCDPVLAAYVWNFKVAVYDRNGTQYTTYPCVCDQDAAAPRLLPAAIEISFNAMSPQAARTVMSTSSDPAEWINMNVNLVKPHAYEFRTRINLQ